MKYYSEVLKKQFDTEKECLEAEESFAKKEKDKEARKTEACDAIRHAIDLVSKFEDDYHEDITFQSGSAIYSIRPAKRDGLASLIETLFN